MVSTPCVAVLLVVLVVPLVVLVELGVGVHALRVPCIVRVTVTHPAVGRCLPAALGLCSRR